MTNSNPARRRYEILLPRQFNDGRPVPEQVIGLTVREVRDRFGAASLETNVIHGTWMHEGAVYTDFLARLFVDVPDTDDNRQFFTDLKERLKNRFKQLDIWITSYRVDVI